MIQVENIEVFNIEGALRGMRNPLNSWKNADTAREASPFGAPPIPIIGENDMRLAQRLLAAGSDHAKFLRQIGVCMDITAPIYWWKEMDTYKVGTTANSTSTMHKIAAKPFERKDFSFDNEELPLAVIQNVTVWRFDDFIENVLQYCEKLRQLYLETGDKRYWRALIQMLPSAYNQRRTWTANYAVLRNIYFARKNHKLTEWHDFCHMIENLPYGKELICLGE